MQAGESLAGTLNSIHNLAYYLTIMQRVRASLQRGEEPASREAPINTNMGAPS